MYFGTSHQTKNLDHSIQMKIQNTELQLVDHYKYLGVTLDKNLNYKLHIDNLLKTLKYKIYILAKLRPYLTTQSSLNIYKTTIMPYIDYGDIFYQAAFKGSLAKIQDRQTKALKICFKLHGNQDENDLHARANLAILEKRRNSHILNFMYKRKENPVYLDQKNLQTRAYQAPKFIVPNFNIIQFKNSILYKGSSMWNELHNETKNIPTYLAFKEKTKILSKQWDLFLSFMKYLLVAKDFETIALSKPWFHTHHIWNHMYSIIHSIYISSHIIPHHYICYDKTGNKCNAGLTGRPVLYTEPINWPRVNFRNKKKKKKIQRCYPFKPIKIRIQMLCCLIRDLFNWTSFLGAWGFNLEGRCCKCLPYAWYLTRR